MTLQIGDTLKAKTNDELKAAGISIYDHVEGEIRTVSKVIDEYEGYGKCVVLDGDHIYTVNPDELNCSIFTWYDKVED